MPTARVRLLLLAGISCFGSRSIAQDTASELRTLVRAAIANPYSEQLRAVADLRPSMQELAEALAAADDLSPRARAFLAKQVVHSLGTDAGRQVEDLWKRQPERRAEWRTLFAAIRPAALVALHAEGDATRRAEIEDLLGLLEADGYEALRAVQLRPGSPALADSARILRRRAATAVDGIAESVLEVIGQFGGTTEEIAAQRDAIAVLSGSVRDRRMLLGLVDLLRHADPRVRARIACVVRSTLRLPVPLALQALGATDPAQILREGLRFDAATVERVVIPRLRVHGLSGLPFLHSGAAPERVVALPRVTRDALRAAIWEILVVPRVAPESARNRFGLATVPTGADQKYDERLRAAAAIARLGGAEPMRLWLDARKGGRLEVEIPVLDALGATRANAAHLLIELARAARDADRSLAGVAADAIAKAAHGVLPTEAHEILVDVTRGLDAARLRELGIGPPPLGLVGCGVRPPGTNWSEAPRPADGDSRLVHAACAAGVVELFEPLLGELRAATKEGRLDQPRGHENVLVQALGALGPQLAPAQAGLLFDTLIDRLVADRPGPGPGGPGPAPFPIKPPGGRPEEGPARFWNPRVADAMSGLVIQVPDDRLPRVAKFLQAGQGYPMQWFQNRNAPRPGPARARWLAANWPRKGGSVPVCVMLAAPEVLLPDLDLAPSANSSVWNALFATWCAAPEAVTGWCESGLLRAEHFARVPMSGVKIGPDLLAVLLRVDQLRPFLVGRVAEWGPGRRKELAILAQLDDPQLAVTAALRLASIDEDGRHIALSTFERFVEREGTWSSILALRGALSAGLNSEVLLAAARSARTSSQWGGDRLGLAILLRAGELTIDEVIAATPLAIDVLGTANVEVGPEIVRRAAHDDVQQAKRWMAGARGTSMCVALLEAAIGDPVWTHALEDLTMRSTSDADPRIRRAAYRVLAATDPRDWPLAVLANEAALDDDPSVRAIAPR